MKHETDAQRIITAHGGKLTRGNWDRATGIVSQMGASLLANALIKVHYQVRSILAEEKSNTWMVIFR